MLPLKLSSLLSCVILLAMTTDVVQSKYVYHPESQRQISQHKEVATWEEAKQHCESEGATLASPLNVELLKYMKSVIAVNSHTTPYFIGFKARHNAQLQFISEEGILLEDVTEASDMVEQLDPRNGDCLCMDGHNILVTPCWTRLPFICYTNETSAEAKTTDIPTTTAEDKPPQCGPGYELSRTGSFYKFYDELVSWEEANSTCAKEYGYLVIVNGFFEARVLLHKIYNRNWPYTWVGLRSEAGTNWRSIQGDPLDKLYNAYVHRRSTEGRQVYDCGALKFDGDLVDMQCQEYQPFICEKNQPCLDT